MHRLDAGLVAGAQQVRPDLGLHHDEEPRPHQREGAAHDEGEIERKVEHLVDVLEIVAGDLLAGHGRRGQEQAQLRVPLAELGQQRARGQHFADRDGVNPDRFVGVEVERNRQVTHPLREAADVFAVTHRLVHERRRHHGKERHDEHAVEYVHDVRIQFTLVRRLTGTQGVH
jgi:hypothetical protein